MSRSDRTKSITVGNPVEKAKEYLSTSRGQTKIITAVVLTIFSLIMLAVFFDFGLGTTSQLEEPIQASVDMSQDTNGDIEIQVNDVSNAEEVSFGGALSYDSEDDEWSDTNGDDPGDPISGSWSDLNSDQWTSIGIGDTTTIATGDGTDQVELDDGDEVLLIMRTGPDNEQVVTEMEYNAA